MEIFLDSVDLHEIEKFYRWGVIDGVTTNPSLMAKAGKDLKNILRDICQIVDGDVSIEAVANDYDGMLEQGEKIFEIAKNVVLKLPITEAGIKACKHFSKQGQKVNMTLCFSLNQAILAAKAGAKYVSPFIGRLDDIGKDGLQLIEEIRAAFDNYADNWDTKILAASIRNEYHVKMCALIGADVVTIAPKLMAELIKDPLTDAGLEKFNTDWKNSNLTI